ncbi:ABC transporter substrate-binding protein [Streptomyces bobili]|uniref:ABC transporter substrate-binding protein n=1 Tax=Streptomyces bobili TaxID=67280 RepID=UPI0033B3AE46
MKAVSNGIASTGVAGKDFGAVTVKKGSALKSAKDLEGKKVAINTLRNINETAVRASVRKAGGDPDEVTFVELPFDQMPAALDGGRIDAAMVVEPAPATIKSRGLRQKALSKARRRELVSDALESVGLADASGACPWQLSGGTQQRVAIARALAHEPHVLLMDEPFAAVDAQTRADLEDLVRGLWQERGITIQFVTHDIDEAVYLGERVIVLSASPTVVREQLKVDLPAGRDQLHTRVAPRFAELRTHGYEQIQAAKRGIPAQDAPVRSDALVKVREDAP